MNINFFKIITTFRSYQTFIIKSLETQHLQRISILFSLAYGKFRSFGAPHASIVLLHTNNALTLVPTRVSKSGHF